MRSKPRSLIVVVTEGCQPVQCYDIGHDRLKTVSVPVPSLDKALIKVSMSGTPPSYEELELLKCKLCKVIL